MNTTLKTFLVLSAIALIGTLGPAFLYPREYGVLAFFVAPAFGVVLAITGLVAIFTSKKKSNISIN